ncbi:hypothetical protein BD309DRAFT_905780, partial [Dichomitus squalens]
MSNSTLTFPTSGWDFTAAQTTRAIKQLVLSAVLYGFFTNLVLVALMALLKNAGLPSCHYIGLREHDLGWVTPARDPTVNSRPIGLWSESHQLWILCKYSGTHTQHTPGRFDCLLASIVTLARKPCCKRYLHYTVAVNFCCGNSGSHLHLSLFR